jgi:hypothetical protein
MSDDAIRVEAYRLRKNLHITLAIQRFHRSRVVETMLTVERQMAELKKPRDIAKASGQLSAAVVDVADYRLTWKQGSVRHSLCHARQCV